MESQDLALLQSNILNTYYSNNAKKLHQIVNKILFKFSGWSNKDMDDFYSLANEVFADVIKRYDGVQSFDGFLYSCLLNRIKSEITKRNRKKRKADRMSISLDAMRDNNEECNLLDFIPSDFDTFEEVTKRQDKEQFQDKVQHFISRLSNQQVNILNLLIDGYEPFEIRQILKISEKEYGDNLHMIKSYENIKILF